MNIFMKNAVHKGRLTNYRQLLKDYILYVLIITTVIFASFYKLWLKFRRSHINVMHKNHDDQNHFCNKEKVHRECNLATRNVDLTFTLSLRFYSVGQIQYNQH